VNVHIDTAREDESARGVDLPPAAGAAADLNNFAVCDANIAVSFATRSNKGPAADD
jgi:hypothetical protein